MSGTGSWQAKAVLILGMIGAVTTLVFSQGSAGRTLLGGKQVGGPRLISVERLPEPEGLVCELAPASASFGLNAGFQPGRGSDEAASARKPVRIIKDPYPSPSALAVDPVRNEVVMTDESTFGVMVYDRLANTPPTAAFTEPKRRISGSRTKIEYQCGIYIDPTSGDIYATNNDTHDTLAIFSRQANGNVPPDREVTTPHSTFGIAVDEDAQEMFLTEQHDNAVVVYKKTARNEDSPVRLLQGDRTHLADPRGVAVDSKNRLLYVINHGNFHSNRPGGIPARVLEGAGTGGRATGKENWPVGDPIPGSGKSMPPSITVYALDARGDTAPLRTIEGSSTQMNWPMGIALDSNRGELFVANDTGHSILVFSATANGNVAPARILKGPKSQLRNPTGVFVDTKNDELWVSNFGSHSATVYKTTASGDTPPLRVIRSSPVGTPAPIIGNPGFVAYDSKRDELLVPN